MSISLSSHGSTSEANSETEFVNLPMTPQQQVEIIMDKTDQAFDADMRESTYYPTFRHRQALEQNLNEGDRKLSDQYTVYRTWLWHAGIRVLGASIFCIVYILLNSYPQGEDRAKAATCFWVITIVIISTFSIDLILLIVVCKCGY